MICVPSRLPKAIPLIGYRRGHSAPFARPGRVRHEDLRVETAAELALQSRPQVRQGRAPEMLRTPFR
jgi:hypothetical protein